MTHKDYLAQKEEVLSAFDKALGTNSKEILRSQSVKRGQTNQGKRNIKDVSKRFNQNCDLENYESFLYVNPTSSQKEKMYSVRAKLLSNQKGLVIFNEERRSPPKNFVEKILKEKRQMIFESIERKK